jgi:hypothetical protein
MYNAVRALGLLAKNEAPQEAWISTRGTGSILSAREVRDVP